MPPISFLYKLEPSGSPAKTARREIEKLKARIRQELDEVKKRTAPRAALRGGVAVLSF
jgi:hypothetical protein